MAEQENKQQPSSGEDETSARDSNAAGGKQTLEREEGESSSAESEQTGEGTGAKAGEYS
jgi:hypothetical protein